MNILRATKAFDRGKRIRRASWPANEMLGFEQGTETKFVGGWPSGAAKYNGVGNYDLYLFTLDDIRAEDWEIVKNV